VDAPPNPVAAMDVRELTILNHPAAACYYFILCVGHGAVSGVRWFISHPLTLCGLLPTMATYLGAKYWTYAPEFVLSVEVSMLLGWWRDWKMVAPLATTAWLMELVLVTAGANQCCCR
jgi:hypothetical protein